MLETSNVQSDPKISSPVSKTGLRCQLAKRYRGVVSRALYMEGFISHVVCLLIT